MSTPFFLPAARDASPPLCWLALLGLGLAIGCGDEEGDPVGSDDHSGETVPHTDDDVGDADTDDGGDDGGDTGEPADPEIDLDGDGEPGIADGGADCDDTDPDSTLVTEDADCDGVPTELDCDDVDPTVGDVDDPECDGIATDAAGGDLFQLAATSFEMGCTDEQPGCFDNEFEVMPVTLTHDYFIGETEVTQAQYDAMMGTNPSFFDACGDDCPVERVSWNMAAAYTNALSAASGLDACYTCEGEGNTIACEPAMDPYTCEGYRLPTEAEWENAARCGTDNVYAGSDAVAEIGWYVRNSDGEPKPVGALPANACGLVDMSGNVIEWTQDRYAPDYYTADGRTDPAGPEEGEGRSVRGGGWQYSASGLRVSYRNTIAQDYRSNYIGFRVARTVL